MKPEQFSAKNVIKQAIADCRATWPLTLQELREVLISCAGDLAAEGRRLTPREADVLPCGHSLGIVFGEQSWNCAVCGEPARRLR